MIATMLNFGQTTLKIGLSLPANLALWYTISVA